MRPVLLLECTERGRRPEYGVPADDRMDSRERAKISSGLARRMRGTTVPMGIHLPL